MSAPLTCYQSEVGRQYLDRIQGGLDVQWVRFRFGGDDLLEWIPALRIRIPLTDGRSLWFSGSARDAAPGPGQHVHQFFGTYDRDDVALTELVAAAAHFDRHVATLGHGHSFPLAPRSALRARGYAGGLLLSKDVDPLLSSLDGAAPSIPTTWLFVVPISAEELGTKRAHGLEPLVERWRSTGRSPFHVLPPAS